MNIARSVVFLVVFANPLVHLYADENRTIVGWAEEAIIYPGNTRIQAKIDSGAEMTSLHCGCEYFRRSGKTWVRLLNSGQKKTETIELPVKRYIKIKRHGGRFQKRAVIQLSICLANTKKTLDVNLENRKGMSYKLLIGRDYLSDDYLIDGSATFLISPACGDD